MDHNLVSLIIRRTAEKILLRGDAPQTSTVCCRSLPGGVGTLGAICVITNQCEIPVAGVQAKYGQSSETRNRQASGGTAADDELKPDF